MSLRLRRRGPSVPLRVVWVVAAWAFARPVQASFPGDNGVIVVTPPGQRLQALDPDGTDPRPLHPDSTDAQAPRWSPEGNRIAALVGGDLVVLLATGELLHTLTSSGDVVAEPSWSPDGTRIAFVRSNGELWIADARVPSSSTPLLPGPVVSAAWNPYAPADQIAYTDGGAVLAVRPDGSEAGTLLLPADPNGSRSELAWNPTPLHSTLSYTVTLGDGTTWIEGDGGAFGIGDGLANGEDRSPAWSPDGTRLFFIRAGEASVYVPSTNGPSFVQTLSLPSTGGGWQPAILTSPSAYEGAISTGTLAQMVFQLRAPAGLLVTVDYATSPGSATDGVNADYVPDSGSVSAPGPFGEAVGIPIAYVGDTDPEADEFFHLEVTFPSDPAAPLRVRGTILNDDGGRGRNGLITYGGSPGGMAIDPASGRAEALTTAGSRPVYAPGGDRYAYEAFVTPRYFVTVTDGTSAVAFNSPGDYPDNLVWSPDGSRLAWTEALTLYVADPTNATPILTLPDVLVASWSNDTLAPRRLAYTPGSASEVWSIRENGTGATLLAADATLAEWSPDGATIAVYEDDGVWFMSPDGTFPRRVVFDGEMFRWSPLTSPFGGHSFVVRRDDGRLVVRAEAGPEILLPELPGVVADIQWAPDGQRLVASVVGADGDQQLFALGADDAGAPFARVGQVTSKAAFPDASVESPRWSVVPFRPMAILEGGAGLEGFQARSPVRLDAPAAQAVDVLFRWYDGTAVQTQDYDAPTSDTVTFRPGETEVPIVWPLLADEQVEATENFGVELVSSSEGRIGTPSNALVYVIDVNPAEPLQISIDDANAWVVEGDSGQSLINFTVTLSGSPSGPVEVAYSTSDGSATESDGDYQGASGIVTLTAASPSATLSVVVLGDGSLEPDEFMLVTLSNATAGAVIVDGQGAGTILNDDSAPVLDAIGSLGMRPELAPVTFIASASDADGDAVSYALVGAPAGAAIDSASGAFSWTPAEEQGPGAYGIVVRAQDPYGNLADQIVEVLVAEVNSPPTLTLTGVPTGPVVADTVVTFTATASDLDLPANQVFFSLAGAPAGAWINSVTGEFLWLPSVSQTGGHTFEVIATDDGLPQPLTSSQTVALLVVAPPSQGGESVFGLVGPSGTVSTDTENDGATAFDPIETYVYLPLGGEVLIDEPAVAPPPPTAWTFLAQVSQITVTPPGTPANPLRLRFVLDDTVAAPAGGAAAIAVFRNGVEVGPCTGAPAAAPDPCVESRQDLPDGDAELVVLTSAASEWRFGTARLTGGLAFALAEPTTGGRVSLSAGSHEGRPYGLLVYKSRSGIFASERLTAFSVESRSAWIAGVGRDGRRFVLQAQDRGERRDRVLLWIDGVAQTGDGALRSGSVLVRP